MADAAREDLSMSRVRAWLKQSRLTLHDLGIKMGYDAATARKSVWQFLRTVDPRIGMLRRFAAAAGVPLEELVAPAKPKRGGGKK